MILLVSTDNDLNWENTLTTNPTTNLATNRSNFTTHLQSKHCHSNNTNKQLANILGYIANILTANQIPSPNFNSRETKACISNTFSGTKSDKLSNFLFQCCLYFCTNLT